MPRRRLHGTTQQRRQKPRTRDLKRRSAAPPPRQTQAAQPFERSTALDPQDLHFLEAMRDLRVQPLPKPGIAPAREQAIQRTHFAAEAEDERSFHAAMTDMGVQPLGSAASPGTGPPPRRKPRAEALEEAEREFEREDVPPVRTRATRAVQPQQQTASTRIHESPEDRKLMEAAFQEGLVKLREKYEGAPAPRPPDKSRAAPQRPRARLAEELEPDAELDLHGKSQEEAIRMVQNFLLTAHRQRLRTALIITGRGLRSGGAGPVLRDAVQSWLERNGAPTVLEFHAAPGRHGGSGAWWVWVK